MRAATETEQAFVDGYVRGADWATSDRANSIPAAAGTSEIMDEIRSQHRSTRAFYLGALRGYRSVARTLKAGRWGL